MLKSLADTVSSILEGLGSQFKSTFPDYCTLETVDDEHVLVGSDGSLCTVVDLRGSQRLRGGENLEILIDRLRSSLQTFFDKRGHVLQAFFEVDPDRTKDEIKEMQRSARNTARRLQIDMEDLLDEREVNLADWVSSERCFFVLWTTSDVLVKVDREHEKKDRSERIKGRVITKNAQDPLRAVAMLRDRHRSFVGQVISELESSGIVGDKLDVKHALREIRMTLDPDFTDTTWEPTVPGVKVPFPAQRSNAFKDEEWESLWPRLSWQMCPRDVEIVDSNVVRVGERLYYPIYVDLFQKEPARFAGLFGRTMDKGLPWRVSFLIEGDGLGDMNFKGLAAQLMGMAGAGNKAVDRAIKELRHRRDVDKETIVQVRACLATWAPRNNPDLLTRRASDLARCVEAWGGCEVSEVTGDPVDGLASTLPAFTIDSIGTKSAAPLTDVLRMLPLTRPCSPWRDGSVLFRSPDGKLMPFEPYSSKQSRWISLIFASPGSGKSVLMNSLNLALCLSPMNQVLPRIAVIDIGPSSSGLISLLKAALPVERRHEVVHKRLRMVERDSINPFDTQLGCRFPTATERQFLLDLLTLMMTEPGQDAPPVGMTSIVTTVLDELYLSVSDKFNPKPFSAGIERDVDEGIRKHRLAIDINSTWWEVVDSLFEAGEVRLAQLAQRHAMPLLQDSVSIVQSEKVRTALGDLRHSETQENLIGSFTRQVATLLSIFPIFARPTAFDVGDARITALDLDEVAKSGGPQADWQTGILYMIARQVMAKDYYLNKDVIVDMPAPSHMTLPPSVPVQKYREFHRQRIDDLTASPKRICFDEFHRTSKCPQVRERVLVDMREGRKFQVDIMLASQSLQDFDERMKEFASSVYIMDSGNAQSVDELGRVFGFDDPEEKYAIERRIHPPRRGGGTFMAKFDTNSGKYSMLMSNTLGPIELWAFSTTAEDVAIRNKLYDKAGPKMARLALAEKYPGGSAKRDVEDRREALKDRLGSVDDRAIGNIVEEIVLELEVVAESIRRRIAKSQK